MKRDVWADVDFLYCVIPQPPVPSKTEKAIPRLLESNKKEKEREDGEERKFHFAMNVYVYKYSLFSVSRNVVFWELGLVRNMVSVVRVMQPCSLIKKQISVFHVICKVL